MRKLKRRLEKGFTLLGRLILRYSLFLRRDAVCTADTPRCDENPYSVNFYWERKGKNSPVCCASHLYELLVFLSDLLTKAGISWFAIIGTHLGIVRHHGLIPWETDGDIGVMIEDRSKVIELLKQAVSGTHYVLTEREGECLRLEYSRKNSLHVDIIWGCHEGSDIVFMTKGIRRVYPESSVYPLKMGAFYDRQFPVPKDDEILKSFYGPYALTHGCKQWSRDKKLFILADHEPAPISAEEKR